MTSIAHFRTLNGRIGAVGRVAALLLLVAVLACVMSMRGLGSAFMAPSAKEVKSSHEEKAKQLADDYAKTLAQHTAQFTGRSVFFIPSAPPPPPPPPPAKVDDTPPPPPPPSKPAVYSGPKLIAMVNDEAWFDDGQKLKIGDEGKDGLTLKEFRPPWEVAVVWKKGDFSVSLFDRDKIVYPAPKEASKPGAPDDAPTSGTAATPSSSTPGEAGTPSKPESEPTTPGTSPAKPETEPATPDSPKPSEPKPAEPGTVEPAPETPKPAEPAAPPERTPEGNE